MSFSYREKELENRVKDIKDKVKKAAKKSHRSLEDIFILPVSKKQSDSVIHHFFNLGFHSFGENYVQEWLKKKELLPQVKWHFIGHIQTNKVKFLVGHCDLIQSVDRLDVAEKISKLASIKNKTQNILIQVNVSDESQKSGCSSDYFFDFVDHIHKLPNLCLKGIMGFPSYNVDESSCRFYFEKLKILYDKLQSQLNQVDTLSMGTSSDYIWAIEQGASLVRLGDCLLGKRVVS